MFKTIAMEALPVGAGFLATRLVVNKFGGMIPGVSSLGAFSKPVLSAALLFGVSKVPMGPFAKHRRGVLIGAGLNLLCDLIGAVAPASLKSMIGLGDAGIYDRALSDYVQVGEYLTTGATPIDDDIALSDYITVGGGVEQELGLEEELGLSEELGDENSFGEGVSQSAMLAPVPQRSFVEPVPARSFTKNVPHAGAGFDNPNVLYTGIFSSGF